MALDRKRWLFFALILAIASGTAWAIPQVVPPPTELRDGHPVPGWQQFLIYRETLRWAGGVILALVVVLALSHLTFYGSHRVRPTNRMVKRYGLMEVLLHTALALAFVGAWASSTYLILAKYVLGDAEQNLPMPLGPISSTIHITAGLLLLGALLALAAVWRRSMRFAPYDRDWLKQFGGYFSRTGRSLPAGRFNAGQKIWFYFSVLIGFLVAVSGGLIYYPALLGSVGSIILYVAHTALGVVLSATVIVHVYLAVLVNPQAVRGIFTGRVDEACLRENHPLAAPPAADSPSSAPRDFTRVIAMLPKVSLGRRSATISANAQRYRMLVSEEVMSEMRALVEELKGIRICHINSTAGGGGVAELLARYVPVLHALEITADWRLIYGEPEFFKITKAFHNALQGGQYDLQEAQKKVYLEVSERSAALLDDHYDVFIVHDPQPAAVRHFAGRRGAKWIWRCHLDSSDADEKVSGFLRPFIEEHDAVVFTMAEFLLPGLEAARVAQIAPAIDPLATKNMELPLDVCRGAIADAGIDPSRPLLVQVSRFDPWKDPLGVIRAYRLVKEEIPGVQLALLGCMASDDPEGWEMLNLVEEESAKDPDMSVWTNMSGVGSMEVNVFQRGCDVVIQKSLREGFGLVVSEAFWKEKPVVAGRAGGIPMQFPEGFERYLVDTVESCAERVVELLNRPGERGAFGRAGRERVRQEFLIPRLLRDELRLIKDVL